MTTQELLQKAKGAKTAMALASTETKNKALSAMADALERHQAEILAANQPVGPSPPSCWTGWP